MRAGKTLNDVVFSDGEMEMLVEDEITLHADTKY
jgi:hypothetical protein